MRNWVGVFASSDIKQAKKQNPNSAASLRTLKPFSTQETKQAKASCYLSCTCFMHYCSSSVLAVPSVEKGSSMHVGVVHTYNQLSEFKVFEFTTLPFQKHLFSTNFSKNNMQHPETSKAVWFHAHPFVVVDKHANKVDKLR